jgi:plasmid stabilization system protein ParE
VKKYRVIVTPEADCGITEAFLYSHGRSPLNAAKWLRGLYGRIDTLESAPKRCAFARESQYFGEALRQLVFKSHRIIFQIEETSKLVYVLYVRHVRQRAVGETRS